MWEAIVQEGWVKPEPIASRHERERWIKAKYEHHGFVEKFAADDGSSDSTLAAMMLKVRRHAVMPFVGVLCRCHTPLLVEAAVPPCVVYPVGGGRG